MATGFSGYFAELWELPPALLVAVVFILVLAVVNFIGITESVVINMLMTFVEVAGLIIVMIIGVWLRRQGNADFSADSTEFYADGNPASSPSSPASRWPSSR